MGREKVYNLEERTYQFARDCRLLIGLLPGTLSNTEDGKQLIKASGSIGANYIEANEKLGRKDLAMRLRIARKEAKEAQYWLRLLKDMNGRHEERIEELIKEAAELRRILSSIINRIANAKEPSRTKLPT
jgi:four helix bundle protein